MFCYVLITQKNVFKGVRILNKRNNASFRIIRDLTVNRSVEHAIPSSIPNGARWFRLASVVESTAGEV